MLIKLMEEDLYGGVEVPIEGSPYLNDEFVEGEVCTRGTCYSKVPMRYNVFGDYVEFMQKGRSYILDPQAHLDRVRIGEATLLVARTEGISDMRTGFFLLLDSGRAQLLSKKVVQFRPSQAPKALESSSTPAKYLPMPDVFFYRFGKREIVKIGSLKKMIEQFPDHREELSSFVKSEKISVRRREDLVKLFKYYNAL